MPALTRNTTLDDAYFFLNQAKGLPEIKSAEALRQRYIRACILFSWVALEEEIDSYLKEKKLALPNRLKDKLEVALSHNGVSFVPGDFQKARKIRNTLTHSSDKADTQSLLRLDSARHVFTYCGDIIARLAGHRKLCLSLDDGTWRPWNENRPPRLP